MRDRIKWEIPLNIGVRIATFQKVLSAKMTQMVTVEKNIISKFKQNRLHRETFAIKELMGMQVYEAEALKVKDTLSNILRCNSNSLSIRSMCAF